MQTTKQPYELLIRWDQEGALSGAHVQHRYIIRDGDKVISESLSDAEPLALDGFPLGDVLGEAQIAALTECERLRSDLEAARAETEAVKRLLEEA